MFSESTLNLLPSNTLASLSNGLTSQAQGEATQLSAEQAREKRLEGYTEVATTEEGRTTITLENTLATIKSVLGIVNGVASRCFYR